MTSRRVLAIVALAVAGLLGFVPTARAGGDPAPTTSLDALDAAIRCPQVFQHRDTEVVLLVHGTAVTAEEHWGWNYAQDLPGHGYDVCTVELPDRMLGDIQVSAEYIAHAITHVAAAHGTDVDVIGHSQGALAPRWVLVHYPEVRDLVDDAVLLAGPHHGTLTTDALCALGSCAPAAWQMRTGSAFVAAANRGDETPGDVDYLSIYSLTDELVQPASTAELDGATNVLLQDLCPKPVHHAGLNSDAITFELVLSALGRDGSADVGVIGPEDCLAPWYAGTTLGDVVGGNVLLYGNGAQALLAHPAVGAEPPLRDYARP